VNFGVTVTPRVFCDCDLMAGVIARKSKIARLPLGVREELNRRLENGEPGADLVRWLNGHRETKRVMAARFEGREFTEQNLSEWRGEAKFQVSGFRFSSLGWGRRHWRARAEADSQKQGAIGDSCNSSLQGGRMSGV